ncbi:hypothetical protein COO20_21440 [Thalassospira marina]|jgi:hypothetical protein|uniref:Uncharacterized protein n=1 Tax=Thalassospira marina TaxID=2048283 RepID=A0A2N3KIQ5_9PROT|nr:hypothetical protein THS27_21655 [Thalassospira sp. MCCC 1A01428]PKR50439.1 hypothetical protein COO20_21440 [Thalassospira marina]
MIQTYLGIKKMKLRLMVALALLVVSGCTNTRDDMEVIGTGRGIDDYKVSPCACRSLENVPPTDKDIQAIKRWRVPNA